MTVPDLYRRFPDGLPDELLDLDDVSLLRALEQPTLIRVPGTGEQRARGIATLLHGDESTGYHATMRVLRRRRQYPFDLWVLFGNVPAALADQGWAHRFLDHQEDFNRVWDLGDPSTAMRRCADGILEELRDADLEAIVDVHNNTGDNPFYAIVTSLDDRTMNLATLFTTTVLKWDLTANTLMEAIMTHRCAAIAVECGLPGQPESLAFAVDALRRFLGAGVLRHDVLKRDYDLLGNLRRVIVKPEVALGFGGVLTNDLDFVVAEDADVHNFARIEAGHVLGHVQEGASLPVVALESDGTDTAESLFAIDEHANLVTRGEIVPVMMTRTVEAARKDVLFYVADELTPDAAGIATLAQLP